MLEQKTKRRGVVRGRKGTRLGEGSIGLARRRARPLAEAIEAGRLDVEGVAPLGWGAEGRVISRSTSLHLGRSRGSPSVRVLEALHVTAPPTAEVDGSRERTPPGGPRAAGVRAVVLYKAVKGGASLVGAAVLVGFLATGHGAALGRLPVVLRHHVAHAWALRAADALASWLSPPHAALVGVALALDGALTSLEAWALRSGRRWGEWLVVVATGVPLPYEALALVEHARLGRGLLFSLNLAVVLYLGRRALRRVSARGAS